MQRKIMSTILITTGFIILAYPKSLELYEDYQQQKWMKQWQESLQIIDERSKSSPDEELILELDTINTQEEIENINASVDEKEIDKEQRESSQRKEYVENHMDGMLEIEKINLYLPILKGVTRNNLNISVASMEGTGEPGHIGNYTIAGHRNHRYGSIFNRLDEVEVGDLIVIDKGKDKYNYIVTDRLYVEPTETWVLHSNKKDKEITLVTCHPMVNATHRLIIKGEIME